jgi:hypothetical protein
VNEHQLDQLEFAFHTIMVHSDNVATMLVITRGADEELTHITWK